MPQFSTLTDDPHVTSHLAVCAANADRRVLSPLSQAITELLTRGVDELAVKVTHDEIGASERLAVAEAAPTMLEQLGELCRQPKGCRDPVVIGGGDEELTITEELAGLVITDWASGGVQRLPDKDFEGLLHALAGEVADDPEFYGDEAAGLAEAIRAKSLFGLPPEIRGEITRRLDCTSVVAMGRACQPFHAELHKDLHAMASVVESAACTLTDREGPDGLHKVLPLIAGLPTAYRLGPLQALAEKIPALPGGTHSSAFNALCEAAVQLTPREQRELFATLAAKAEGLQDTFAVMREWLTFFNAIRAIYASEPSDRGEALDVFVDKWDYSSGIGPFATVLSAVRQLDSADPHKGSALFKLAWGIGRLPAEYRPAGVDRTLLAVLEFDSADPEKGSVLTALAWRIRDLPDAHKAAAFNATLSAALELDGANPRKGEALVTLAQRIRELPGPDQPAVRAVILSAARQLDSANPQHRLADVLESFTA